MRLTYFHRNKKAGFSIDRVFKTITTRLRNDLKFNEYYVPKHRSLPLDVIRNIVFVYKHRNKTGINHITGDISYCAIALIGCKCVITIHDLVVLNHGNFIKKCLKGFFWIYLPLKIADKVTCISKQTENQICRYMKTSKTSVIHNAVDPSFRYSLKGDLNQKPIILHIGTGWNKNLSNVIEAISPIDCHIRIIGNISTEIRDKLAFHNISYSNSFGLLDAEIIKEYQLCDIVSFPSIYEGFGMPIIEGQKTGRPVLTSNIEPLLEIGGDSVTYVDPNDIRSIRQGFEKLILDPTYCARIIEAGLKNVKRFDVENITKNYRHLYEQI